MKKSLFILLIITILLALLCACDNKDINPTESISSDYNTTISTTNIENEEIESLYSDGVLFSTPYTVEDYVENAIIVSKNDQLLYGVLDNNGNEVIPIKYDEIDFINKENYINGIDDELYFLAWHEGVSTVLNINAEEILSTSRSVWSPAIITTDIKKRDHTDNSPYFIERLNYRYALYNEKGDFLYEVASPGSLNADGEIWLSDSVFCYYSKHLHDGANISTYNSNEEQINSLKGTVDKLFSAADKVLAFIYDKRVISFSYEYRLDGMKLISIDSNGIITIVKEFETLDEYKQELEKAEYEFGSKKYNLYTTNGTWKLEDPSGNTLYDERYYNSLQYNIGSESGIMLTNEDNEVCLINRKGIMCIDYGVLTYNNEALEMLTFDSKKKVYDIYEGENSVIIPISSSNTGYYDIYYFGEKKQIP